MDSNNIKFNIDFLLNKDNYNNNIQLSNQIINKEEFYNKIKDSIDTIESAFTKFPFQEISLSFNGGKDCCVLLHLINHVLVKFQNNDNNNNIDNKNIENKNIINNSSSIDNNINCSSNSNINNKGLKTIYFQTPNSFNEVNEFTEKCSSIYNLNLLYVSSGIKEGLEKIIESEKIKAVFIGIRYGDPNSSHLKKFSFTDPGWPHFLRVNPILEWNYHEIWEFIKLCNIPYCCLYDQGYTSIGHVNDTIPNPDLLVVTSPHCININDSNNHNHNHIHHYKNNSDNNVNNLKYHPAYLLKNADNERLGRGKNLIIQQQHQKNNSNNITEK